MTDGLQRGDCVVGGGSVFPVGLPVSLLLRWAFAGRPPRPRPRPELDPGDSAMPILCLSSLCSAK